jgi:hypothetical protein
MHGSFPWEGISCVAIPVTFTSQCWAAEVAAGRYGALLMTHIYLAAHHEISGRPHLAPVPRVAGWPGPARRAYYRTGARGHPRSRLHAPALRGERRPGCTVRAPGGPGVRTGAGSGPGLAAPAAAGQVQGALAVRDPRGEHGCVRPCWRAGERSGRSRCDVFAACIAPKVIRAARPPCGEGIAADRGPASCPVAARLNQPGMAAVSLCVTARLRTVTLGDETPFAGSVVP